jgi:hypothetical protein
MTTIKTAIASLLIAGLAFAGITGCAEGAGSRYLSGAPELRASITGGNEFVPGDDLVLTLYLENQGVDQTRLFQAGEAAGEPPSTAMMVTAALLPGNAPVVVKTDSQMVGTLPGGSGTEIAFSIKVPEDAPGGSYLLRLVITYTQLASEGLVGDESVIFHYTEEETTLDLPFVIKDIVSLTVPEVRAAELTPGGEGYVTLVLENKGTGEGRKPGDPGDRERVHRRFSSGSCGGVPVQGKGCR